MIKELNKALIQQLKTSLTGSGITLKVVPSVDMIEKNIENNMEVILAIQNPTLELAKHDYQIEETYAGTNTEGTKYYDQKKWRAEMNVIWRSRLFTKTTQKAFDAVEYMIKLSGQLIEITYNGKKYPVIVNENYDPDIVPNLSNIKHFESTIRIEQVEVRPDTADAQVYEILSSHTDMDKK